MKRKKDEVKHLEVVDRPIFALRRTKEYRPSLAMMQAAKRAADHPKPVSMSTKVRDYVKVGEEK